jgi:ChaB
MVESRRYRRHRHELPATLRRSGQDAQEASTKAHDRTVQAYGEGDQADRAAYTALKEKYERRGDHWIAKRHPTD